MMKLKSVGLLLAMGLVIVAAGSIWLYNYLSRGVPLWKTLKDPEVVRQLQNFVAMKEAQANAATNQPVPGFASFFAAAKRGDWLEVSNRFAHFREHAGQFEYVGKSYDDRLRGPRWEAVKEVWGAFDAFGAGDEKYSAAFGRDIIASIPPGSIYFGGTDPGRFIVTAMSRSQVNGDPFFVLTQNALADGTYLDYLRHMYGNKIYIPNNDDSQRCYQECMKEITERSRNSHFLPGEYFYTNAYGRVQAIVGTVAVMGINSPLAKTIFEKNPGREFYVEESFPLDWMCPQLEPHGLIFKLNRQPLAKLSDEIVQRDHDYWVKLVQSMIGDWLKDDTGISETAAFAEKVFKRHDFNGFSGDQRYIQNAYAQKMFSKSRVAIAGLYEWRAENTADDRENKRMAREADFAFRQAWALCPYSPETTYRYVNFLVAQQRINDALVIAEAYAAMPQVKNFDGGTAAELIKQLKEYQRQNHF